MGLTDNTSAASHPGVMYAAIKWPVDGGPNKRNVANDLEILALTLAEQYGWTYDEIETMFQTAIDSVEWHS